jgi:hypothetical protein
MAVTLSSWNDGSTKSAITDFVARVTEEGRSDYVAPPARVAVFDNDGTLWTEKPLVIQLDFTIRRFRELAENDPALRTQQPYQAAYESDLQWMNYTAGAEQALEVASRENWTVVSMKNDWNTVFTGDT